MSESSSDQGKRTLQRRCLLTDVGNVMLTVDVARGTKEIAALYGTTPEKVHHFVTGSIQFHEFERGNISSLSFHRMCDNEFGTRTEFDDFKRALGAILGTSVAEVLGLWKQLSQARMLVASASNVNTIHHDQICTRFPDMFGSLDTIGASFQMGARKGDKDYFARLLAKINESPFREERIRPEDCVFVDDIQGNLDFASREGIGGVVLFKYDGTPGCIEQLREDLARAGIPREHLELPRIAANG